MGIHFTARLPELFLWSLDDPIHHDRVPCSISPKTVIRCILSSWSFVLTRTPELAGWLRKIFEFFLAKVEDSHKLSWLRGASKGPREHLQEVRWCSWIQWILPNNSSGWHLVFKTSNHLSKICFKWLLLIRYLYAHIKSNKHGTLTTLAHLRSLAILLNFRGSKFQLLNANSLDQKGLCVAETHLNSVFLASFLFMLFYLNAL